MIDGIKVIAISHSTSVLAALTACALILVSAKHVESGAPTPSETMQTGATSALVRAERFELVDADGAVRANLGSDVGGTGLALFDAAGLKRAFVFVSAEGVTAMSIHDGAGDLKMNLAVGPELDAIPLISLGGMQQHNLSLMATDIGPTGLMIGDGGSRAQATIALDRNSLPFVEVRDATGRSTVVTPR